MLRKCAAESGAGTAPPLRAPDALLPAVEVVDGRKEKLLGAPRVRGEHHAEVEGGGGDSREVVAGVAEEGAVLAAAAREGLEVPGGVGGGEGGAAGGRAGEATPCGAGEG